MTKRAKYSWNMWEFWSSQDQRQPVCCGVVVWTVEALQLMFGRCTVNIHSDQCVVVTMNWNMIKKLYNNIDSMQSIKLFIWTVICSFSILFDSKNKYKSMTIIFEEIFVICHPIVNINFNTLLFCISQCSMSRLTINYNLSTIEAFVIP